MLLDPNAIIAEVAETATAGDPFLYCDHGVLVTQRCEQCAENGEIAADNPPEAENTRVPLCCERIGNGAWCWLEAKHRGDHVGPAPVYGPVRDPEKKFYTAPRVSVCGLVTSPAQGAWRDHPGRRVTEAEGGYVSPEDPK